MFSRFSYHGLKTKCSARIMQSSSQLPNCDLLSGMSYEEARLFLDGWLNANINRSNANVVIAKVIERYTYTAITFLEQSPRHKTSRSKI